MSVVVDFAWTKPSVAQLKSWNAVAVGMYVSHDPTKNATPALIQAYAAAGIKTFLFFEDAANNASKGYAQGVADATFALAQAKLLGKPPWAPIVFTCDYDVPDYAPASSDPLAKLGPVGQYFKGVDSVIGVSLTAGYGDYYVVKRLTAARLVSYSVQTLAWSGGQIDLADITLYQNGQMLDNGQVDIEVIESAKFLNYLAWVPGEANPHGVAVSTFTIPGIPGAWQGPVLIVGRGNDGNIWLTKTSDGKIFTAPVKELRRFRRNNFMKLLRRFRIFERRVCFVCGPRWYWRWHRRGCTHPSVKE